MLKGDLQPRDSEILSRTVESYFLPKEKDYIRASTTDELPPKEYRRLQDLIREALMPLFQANKFNRGSSWPRALEVFGMDATTLSEFSHNLELRGIEPWQVAVREQFIDEGVYPFKLNDSMPSWTQGPKGAEHGVLYPEVSQELKNLGYRTSWDNTFPHVNLHHLLILAQKYPDVYFAFWYQPLEVIPVPGVQFFSYGFGIPLKLGALGASPVIQDSEEEGWDLHWGDKYNEKFKGALRSKLALLDDQGKVGEKVLDLGCGERPVSSELFGRGKRIILLDQAQKVLKTFKDKPDLIPVLGNFDDLEPVQITGRLKGSLEAESVHKFDTVILSDILNYSKDWRALLNKARSLLTPGGLLLVSNTPDQGYGFSLSTNRPRDNSQIVGYLRDELACVIEEVEDANQVYGTLDRNLPISRYGHMVCLARG